MEVPIEQITHVKRDKRLLEQWLLPIAFGERFYIEKQYTLAFLLLKTHTAPISIPVRLWDLEGLKGMMQNTIPH